MKADYHLHALKEESGVDITVIIPKNAYTIESWTFLDMPLPLKTVLYG